VTLSVVGAALFLRYSLTAFLRFWLARQSFDLAVLGDRLAGDHLNGDRPEASGEAEYS
jgi:hypothetical protein